MPELSLAGVVVVAAVAFAIPLLLGLFPRLRLPSVVLEIVVGIVLGPSVLDWVQVDLPLQVLSLLGLAFLLFLAGLEIDVHQLRGRLLGLVTASTRILLVRWNSSTCPVTPTMPIGTCPLTRSALAGPVPR